MVSESDLPHPVSGPVLNAPVGPGAAGRADPEERLEWQKLAEQLHDSSSRPGGEVGGQKLAEQLHDNFSRPGSGRKCQSGGEVGVAGEGQHIQGNIFIYCHDLRGRPEI